MMPFGRPPATDPESEKWKYKLNCFSQDYAVELAALAWGFLQEQGEDSDKSLGIDIKPEPHFVACDRAALETLNRRANNHLQEILGILDGTKRDREVSIIGIGEGQIMLLHFEPDPAPPQCFEQIGKDVNTLFDDLEQQLQAIFAD
ncbi:MAG: hypothetical protein SAJ12_05525 [Jaaginema sp. PMC 1079.18]|nr:hypothetical protein [Jaaginema sp. PMC 1080.18]MEC4850451.1 hypothetical protein [Jaaginema sp. PMC 1079.18]MEC4867515.1 hypothetical protein [Jaaginema sp. PMC 1078.18]